MSSDAVARHGSAVPAGDCVALAATLGWRLAREAVWHEDRCNWVGADFDEDPESPDRFGVAYRALTANVYDGTAGVASFLAELWKATGEPEFRRTALGALRHAVAAADRAPPEILGGLYTGPLGVAVTAAEIGVLLDAPSMLAAARTLSARTCTQMAPSEDFDLMYGKAGTIIGLLALASMCDDGQLAGRAARVGDHLLAEACPSDAGLSWRSFRERQPHALCGLSHGAAGAGLALFELYGRTGDARYRRGGEGAYAYERSWFEPAMGNWPDLRSPPRRSVRPSRPRYAAFWCHGAPGIALTRLRAFELTGDEQHAREAAVALETTRATVARVFDTAPRDFCLCHGVAGNAEILLEGASVLGRLESAHSVVAAVVQTGLERFGGGDVPWPLGIPAGEPPGLFIGLSGVGHFLLRVAGAATTSPLLLRPGLADQVDAPTQGRA